MVGLAGNVWCPALSLTMPKLGYDHMSVTRRSALTGSEMRDGHTRGASQVFASKIFSRA